MTSNLVSGIMFLQGNDGKIIVIRVVRTIHDVHTDAHLEHDFVPVLVLVLVLDLVLSESLPAVALFTRCGSALSRSGCSFPPALGSFHLSEVIVGVPVNSSLFSTVQPCVRSRRRLRAPNSNNLCNMRSLLRQGLGCPRADPRVHHRTFFNVLRVVWEIPASL